MVCCLEMSDLVCLKMRMREGGGTFSVVDGFSAG